MAWLGGRHGERPLVPPLVRACVWAGGSDPGRACVWAGGSDPGWGVCKRQPMDVFHTDVSLPLFLPPFPLSKN